MISSEGLRPSGGGRKPLGKLAARLEEVKNPWRTGAALELSHSEAARLATDALLELGEPEYRRVLAEERELSFLSPLELRYIGRHAARSGGPDSNGAAERDCGDADAASELTSGTYFPMMSDEEPPMLELGWPEAPNRGGASETQVYFQRDKSHNVKDLIRSLIDKASKVVAIVMDIFTDVDLLCDLMEASNKRRVPVYVLLDQKNLQYFTDMCTALDVHNSHLSNMRIRSVCGDTYCTKSGKKFTGQVLEKFMIIDCQEVVAGSYSFTWLSAQVHTNMVMHFSGRIADCFDREFRCLYADSQVIDCFSNPEEAGLPFYPSYHAIMAPGLAMGFGPAPGLDPLSDRQRRSSDNSSSQSSNSVSSVKAAPGMTSSAVYKVTQGGDRKEPGAAAHLSPDRRAGPTPAPAAPRANGGANHAPAAERLPPPPYSQAVAVEWNKAPPPDALRSHVGGASSKFQALGLYDHKAARTPSPVSDRTPSRQRTPSNQLLSKLSDLFLPPPGPASRPSAWGGPDLSQAEPESQQSPPPPPSPAAVMSRHEQKRMTLGHSKLDLLNQYNQLKTKQVYSRFELKAAPRGPAQPLGPSPS